jgi:transposase
MWDSVRRHRKTFTAKHAEEFYQLHFEKNMTLRQIAKKFDTSHGVIKNTLKKFSYRYKTRQYPLNEDFFKSLDTYVKQYMLGWLYSDGCLFAYDYKKYYGFSIKIQKRDDYILYFFKELLQSYAKITSDYTEGREYSRLKIGSKRIYEDLLQYGLTPRKTFKLKYPQEILSDHRPFILGLFDGDGCISLSKKDKNPYISFTGTEDMVTNIQNILEYELGISGQKIRKIRKNGNTYVLAYEGSNQGKKIGDWMYSWNPPIYLTRKKELFDQLHKIPKYGKSIVVFKCPECNKIGEFEKRNIKQLQKYTFNSKFCSTSCAAKFNRKYQLNGNLLTEEMERNLKENIVGFKKQFFL